MGNRGAKYNGLDAPPDDISKTVREYLNDPMRSLFMLTAFQLEWSS